jgi:hypothetical protein
MLFRTVEWPYYSRLEGGSPPMKYLLTVGSLKRLEQWQESLSYIFRESDISLPAFDIRKDHSPLSRSRRRSTAIAFSILCVLDKLSLVAGKSPRHDLKVCAHLDFNVPLAQQRYEVPANG